MPAEKRDGSSDESKQMENVSKKEKLEEFVDEVEHSECNNNPEESNEIEGSEGEYFDCDDYDQGFDDFSDFDLDSVYEFRSDSEESWRYPWRRDSQSHEAKLEDIERMLKVWKDVKIEEVETLDKAEKLLKKVRTTLDDSRNVGIATIDSLQKKSCEYEEVLNEIQKATGKIQSEQQQDDIIKKGSCQHDNILKLKSLKLASFILQAQNEVLTKEAFANIKKGKELVKESEDQEKTILGLVATQKKKLAQAQHIVKQVETDKGNILKQIKGNIAVNIKETDSSSQEI